MLNYNTLFDSAVESLSNKYVEQYNSNHKYKKITLDDVDIIGDIFIQLINKARNGDLKAMQIFFDYTYGKPRVMRDTDYGNNTEEQKILYYEQELIHLKSICLMFLRTNESWMN